ncbi:hypothetical protein [Parasphingorhabdus sp.]|uniref:hypothetical protein n=1 Tax=Parasphingorhabdus sp. TaxID=2709688 RepID=UPI003BAF0874
MSYQYPKNAFRASLPVSVTSLEIDKKTRKSEWLAGTAVVLTSASLSTVAQAGTLQTDTQSAVEQTRDLNTQSLKDSLVREAVSNTKAANPTQSAFSIKVDENRDVAEASVHNVQVRVDSLLVQPVLSAGLVDSERTVVRGEKARFVGYTNYPALVEKAEVRIFADGKASDGKPMAVAEVDADGAASWLVSGVAPENLYYVYRVYGAKGRFDETKPQELTVLDEPFKQNEEAPSRPEFGLLDQANIRNISTSDTVAVTVTGKADQSKDNVRVSGQYIPIDDKGNFVAKQIIRKDVKKVEVQIARNNVVNLDSSYSVFVPKSDWFFVGQGDLTFITSTGNGPAVDVSGDILSDGDYLTSRAAYYLSGKFGNGWKLTSSLDTGEVLLEDLFNNIDRKDPRQLLRRLDNNEYYPTYGDDSVLVEDAPTQTGFYARLEHHDSSIIVGNFIANFNQAELAQLDRGLFGGLIDYKSSAVTSFGERKLQLTAFASDPGTVPARDEFRGTGGSLYFLNRQDLTIGSERLRIETRDRETGLVLSSVELRPQEDYDVDYFQGRITLARPLASVASDGEIVRQGSSAGNIPVLVVRYEYTPLVGDLDGYTVGTRGAGWIGEHVRLGVTSQKETTETADQTLLGADVLLRYAAGTYIKAEIARTEGPGFGQSNSVDGGLNFLNIASPAAIGQSADAYRAEVAIDIAQLTGADGNLGKVGGYFEHFDAGFSSNSQLSFSDTERWGVHADLPIGKNTHIKAKYDELSTATNGSTAAATGEITQKFGGGVSGSLGIRHDERTPGLLFNSVENGKRTDAAFQVDYNPEAANWSAYGFSQLTLENDNGRFDNNRGGAGVKAELTDKLTFSGELSGGDGGLGADVQLNRRLGEGSEAYIGYALLADRNDTGLEAQNLFNRSNSGTLTVGARQRFSSSLSIYGENRIGHGGTAPSLVRSFGLTFDPSEHWSFSGSFENGRIDDATTGVFKRTAATLGAGYSKEGLKISSQVEARFENGNGRDQEVWLFRNNVNAEINLDWRFLGRLNFAIADEEGPSVRAADFVEGVAGFAYRPVDNDRLNVLARYNYFRDLGPVGQITQGGEINSPKQVSQIASIDINYDLAQWLTIGGKYGYRQGKVSLGRNSDQFVSSNTHLGVLRADVHFVKDWDALVEGRLLTNDIAGNTRYGFLAAIYRHLGNNVKIGVGYSFTDFSDDLSDQSYTSDGLFINLLGKF